MDGPVSEERRQLFALVAYMPAPLAGFFDALRDELAPGCRLRAHITILPPRELSCGIEIAAYEIAKTAAQAHSFRVSLSEVTVFKGSDVIHVSISDGLEQLRELNVRLNQGTCRAPELWNYEPHVTLAQDLEPSAVSAALDLAVRRWRAYSGPRSFALDQLTFVRRTLENEETAAQDCCWLDLKTWELPSAVLA